MGRGLIAGGTTTITIAWDVDDVLNDLMRCWFEAYYEGKNITYKDIIQNPPLNILDLSLTEYLYSLDKFRISDEAFKMEPNEEILNWFQRNGKNFRHIALSATPINTAPVSAYWVTKHFGQWIQSYNFVPSKRDEIENYAHNQNKKDFLKWFEKADILVDDNIQNIKDAESIGIKGVLISKPWNTGGYSVKEALEVIDKYTKKTETIGVKN